MRYTIKCDRLIFTTRYDSLVCGERYVYKSKKYDRYYVQSKYSLDDNLKLFVTKNLNKAKKILALVHEVWTTDFYIIGVNDDGTEIKIN